MARLLALSAVTGIVGSAVYKTGIPETHDMGANGPCLTYEIPSKPYGHVLTGSDGTATATTKVSAWSYSYGTSKQLIESVWNGLDGPGAMWGNGTCQIVSITQQDDNDNPIPPKAGTDQWIYRVDQVYRVMYRVALPNLV